MKFKRAFLMEPHRFEIHEVEEEPGPGEVMMKVASCGLCNWELNFWDGNLNFMATPTSWDMSSPVPWSSWVPAAPNSR